ncbi:MAG: hypothetical protein EXS16_14160 [Gemmataceae bacterium]|nr:hypothetical protein [Gemmataceae bacterium]
MSLVCAQCSRVNPNEAAYCFYDGAALAGRAGGPINAGSAPFPNQFVFPNGQACRNFDQLAVVCQQYWPQAIDLLKQGFLGSFFGGLGRVDLAMAAQEAAKFPDIDRGLDQLLGKLPTQAVQEPKLQAEPSEINVGVLKIGQDRASELHLTNLGMRLVYGTVTSDCKWLTVGDGAGHSEKLFQFGSDTLIPIHVRGQHLRAGSKPLEGHLIVDSNGGTVTVTVKVDVPITPYAGGLFAGAMTPRQIAEKAKANPKETAPSFESGDIAKWYASNGWAYPVQGPTMSGMGAIQQFFEALGVAKAPKVDFAPQSLDLQGAVGKTVEATIEITTAERKVVYGWATSSVDWIEVGQTKLSGKSATVPITIRVPSPCPPKLETTLQLVGNGGQKLTVPIKVNVIGGKAGVALKTAEAEIQILEPDTASTSKKRSSVDAPSPLTPPNMTLPTPATSGSPFSFDEPATGAGDPSPFAVTESSPMPKSRSDSGASSDISKPKPGTPLIVRLMLYLLPLAMLFVVILVLLIHDFFVAGNAGGGTSVTEGVMKEIDPRPHIMIRHNEGTKDGENDDHMTFAVHKINPNDKDEPPLKLNYYVTGAGNSTMLAIDDLPQMVLGHTAIGNWIEKKAQKAGKFGDDGRSRTFKFTRGNIEVIQTVTLEPSDPDPNIPGDKKRLLNTCLARYKITNKDKKPHIVGMRILIDGTIGEKDDVPFTIPGIPGVVTTFKDLKGKEVPDFVECMENADISKPGTVVRIGLKISDKFEAPDRFLLTHYPGKTIGEAKGGYKEYDVPVVPFIGKKPTGKTNFGGDSCAVMYWNKKELKPGETREMGFTYGLGSVTVGGSGKLALTVGGRMFTGGELTVVALVADEKATTATLELPPGLEHIDPSKQTQLIEKALREGRPSPVTWQVRATRDGEHLLSVTTDSDLKNQRKVKINAKSLFN